MALMRWSPTTELSGLHSAMDRLFGDMFGDGDAVQQGEGDGQRRTAATYRLPVDIQETDTGYRIQTPVPGFRPEDVEVTFSDGVLTIQARRSQDQQQQQGNYIRRELWFGNYIRRLGLPDDIEADNIKASFDNGLLTVEVPRKAKPEPKRIQVASQGEKR